MLARIALVNPLSKKYAPMKNAVNPTQGENRTSREDICMSKKMKYPIWAKVK